MEAEWRASLLKGEFQVLIFSKFRQLEIQSHGGKAVGGLSMNRQIDQKKQYVS